MAFSVVSLGQPARGMYPGAQGAMHVPMLAHGAPHMKQSGPARKGRLACHIARNMWRWHHMKDH
jgi:hypothetical protein